MSLRTTIADLGKSFEKLKTTMSNEQLDKAVSMMNELVKRDAEMLSLLIKMSPEDQKQFLPRVLECLDRTGAVVNNIKQLHLQPVLV